MGVKKIGILTYMIVLFVTAIPIMSTNIGNTLKGSQKCRKRYCMALFL